MVVVSRKGKILHTNPVASFPMLVVRTSNAIGTPIFKFWAGHYLAALTESVDPDSKEKE